MKFLILSVLVLAVIWGCSAQTSTDAASSTDPLTSVSTSLAPDSTTGAPGASTAAQDGTTGLPGSTVTPGSTEAPTTAPLILTTFKISNALTPQDAKLILQQAMQLDQQIKDLNTYLIDAQADTNVNNSPLFGQLADFSANITQQNATLQDYIGQLQALQTVQLSIDQRVTSATNTFTCFAGSFCVTPTPTTPAPTSSGPAPSVTPCPANPKLTANMTAQSYNQSAVQNAANCSVSVVPTVSTNNASILIDIVISGSDAYVQLVETRTQRAVKFNSTQTGSIFTGFQQIDVFYYSGERSSVQFNFTYVEVNTCTLNCNSPNGTCKVSQSGAQYCECQKCQFSGDDCGTPMPSPCQAKQRRVCGENYQNGAGQGQPYGKCYLDICDDQCYACACSDGLTDDSNPQTCKKPTNDNFPAPDTAPTGPSVCPTTVAPTTTLLTTPIVPSTVPVPTGGSSQVPASPATGSSDSSPTTPVSVATDASTITISGPIGSDTSATTVTAEPTTTSTTGGGKGF